jgi:hypothetical protein
VLALQAGNALRSAMRVTAIGSSADSSSGASAERPPQAAASASNDQTQSPRRFIKQELSF